MSTVNVSNTYEINPDIRTYNPLVSYDPYHHLASNEQMASFLKICTVALTVFCAISLSLVGLTAGASLLPAAGCLLAYRFIIKERYESYEEKIMFDQQLIEHMSYLDPANIQLRLNQLGITAGQMPTENLKGLLARFRVYDEKRLSCEFSDQKGAYAIEMAYLLKLIESPREKRSIKGFCIQNYQFNPFTGTFKEKQHIYYASHNKHLKTDKQTYNLYDLTDKNPVNLSKELFGTTPASHALEKSSWF